MKKMFIKKVKKMLEDQRKEMLEKAAKATRIELDASGDEVDSIQAQILLRADAQLVAREKERFARIENALKRIADGEYGMCAQCSEDISEARLLINPTFHICVVCAEKNERLKRQHAH
jgi:DnaK suppressor protein